MSGLALVGVAAVAWIGISKCVASMFKSGPSQEQWASMQARSVASEAVAFWIRYERPPAGLYELTAGQHGNPPRMREVVLADPWGTGLRFEAETAPQPRIVVTSAGPDREFGTRDDVVATKEGFVMSSGR